MIRRATHADIDFLLTVARQQYPAFDERLARAWLIEIMRNPDVLVLRGERGGIVVSLIHLFYEPAPRAHMVFLVALPSRGMFGESIALLREADSWRRGRGASCLTFGAATGIDFTPLAKRLGARVETSYVLDRGPVAVVNTSPLGAGTTALDQLLSSPLSIARRA